MANIPDIDTPDVCAKDEHDMKCAPKLMFESGSCIKLNILIEMAKAYNEETERSGRIKLFPNMETLNPKKYKKYLLREFKNKIQNCTTQKCWSEQSFINQMENVSREELLKYTFRPDGPDGRFEWLNTLNINDVMEQYEKKYGEFKFLGAVPMDFDDFERFGIKNLNYKDLVNIGKTKIGVVFNLDNHDQPGSHWVGLYANLKAGELYYFDSYGTMPCKRVRTLMRRIANFSQTGMGVQKLRAEYNKTRHQYENSECGVYSLNFIIRLLRGDDFQDVCKSKIPDKKVNKCRKVYFGNKINGL